MFMARRSAAKGWKKEKQKIWMEILGPKNKRIKQIEKKIEKARQEAEKRIMKIQKEKEKALQRLNQEQQKIEERINLLLRNIDAYGEYASIRGGLTQQQKLEIEKMGKEIEKLREKLMILEKERKALEKL